MHYSEYSCIGPTQDDATHIIIDGYQFASFEANPPHPVWGNQTPGGQNKLSPSADRAKLRSITYQGIAEAMAEQWIAQASEQQDLFRKPETVKQGDLI